MVEVTFGNTPDSDYPNTIEDTFIGINNENNSEAERLNTYTWPANMIANSIIMKWNLSAIPQDAVIISAKVHLYLIDSRGDVNYTNSVHKIINHNPVISATTGYTYDGVNSWTPNTQSYEDIPLAQADINLAEDSIEVDTLLGYKTWNATQMVQEWISGANPNYGMLINSDPNATSDSYRFYASTEDPDPNLRPKLVIEYVMGTICATLTIIEHDPCEGVEYPDYCDYENHIKYYNGRCVDGECIYDVEYDSVECGYVPPDPCEGVVCPDVCIGQDLYSQKCIDGICVTDAPVEINSTICGYVPPDPCAGVVCPDIYIGNERWSRICDPDTGECVLNKLVELDTTTKSSTAQIVMSSGMALIGLTMMILDKK